MLVDVTCVVVSQYNAIQAAATTKVEIISDTRVTYHRYPGFLTPLLAELDAQGGLENVLAALMSKIMPKLKVIRLDWILVHFCSSYDHVCTVVHGGFC